jgi:hypothetical protein
MLQDLASILRSIRVASAAALRVNGGNADYAAGQQATLLAVATALGIAPHELRLQGEEETWTTTNMRAPY